MSEQKTRKNKIGARYLSDLEAELILPTYERIYHQIEQFRMEKGSTNRSKIQRADNLNENQSRWNQDKDQKTNNIGIIGVRGAGKTSILKTIRIQLQSNKRKPSPNDIILPIIVPENMSESGTLMATILGMLSDVIKERDEKEQKKQRRDNKDCIRKSSLRTKCEEVIKQYTYIQKEYRDILIQQYTTENAYVGGSAKVFNSDTEFINRFNELIDELLDVRNQNDGLLFLFIDDIDLSTYRCADIVKTLLSYLSNENIVTFISGDLETFEEALTLSFLRKEEVLDKDILGEKIGNKTLLNSKQDLAYEYLKKIIPPAYRYNIKHWSLEEKGNYCVEDSSENWMGEDFPAEDRRADRQKAGITLSDLLSRTLKGWIDPAFFRYTEIRNDSDERNQNDNNNQDQSKSQGENSGNNERYQITADVLPYTYHLFDDTSRGLNNIYNVLGEIAAARMLPETDELKEKKLLLDTIISSKPIYNEYRNEIRKNFYHVGTKKTDSRVFFDNAKAIIYKKDTTEVQEDNPQKQEKLEKYHITKPIERFSLFILVDFAARLLYENDYENQIKDDRFYTILKEEAMQDLFFHPVIAEKVMEVSTYSWESKQERESRNAALAKGKKEYPTLEVMKLKDINNGFLLKGDLVLNLAYYKNLPLDEMLKLYEDKSSEESNQEPFVTAELEQSTVIAIWKAFSSIAKVNDLKAASKVIARYYSVFWKEFAYIRNRHSGSVTQNISTILFDDEINTVVNKDTENSNSKKQQMQRILSNTLAKVLRVKDKDEIQDAWQEIQYNNLYIVGKNNEEREVKDDTERENIKKRVQLLKIIDSNSLWQKEAVADVTDYLRWSIRRYLTFIKKELKKNELEEKEGWQLNTSDAEDSWNAFEKMYAGETMTKARHTRENVRQILKEKGTNFKQGMLLETYRGVIDKLQGLAGNNLVWYGQSEAQIILNELQKASAQPPQLDEPEQSDQQNQPEQPNQLNKSWDEWIGQHSYFKFLLQCLYKYRMEMAKSKHIIQNARLLTHITKELSVAHKDADRQTLENFIAELNRNLKEEDKIDSESYEKLFSYK